MSKIDKLQKDFVLRNIFYDKGIKEKVDLVSKLTHIPGSCILPMQNRTLHQGKRDEQNLLTVHNLLEIIQVADNYMNQMAGVSSHCFRKSKMSLLKSHFFLLKHF